MAEDHVQKTAIFKPNALEAAAIKFRFLEFAVFERTIGKFRVLYRFAVHGFVFENFFRKFHIFTFFPENGGFAVSLKKRPAAFGGNGSARRSFFQIFGELFLQYSTNRGAIK